MKTIKIGSKGDEVKTLQRRLNLAMDGIFGKLTEEAVREFQKLHGLIADGIVGTQTWQALGVSNIDLRLKQSKRVINEIIVHCSATPEGKDYTVDDITAWHKQRGFITIGYHYVIYRDGSIKQGRDVNVSGAHCTGHNTHSIGVCYIGGCEKDGKTPKDTRTKKQKESLLWLLKGLKELYPKATICGHRDFARKACPSFDATNEYKGV
jgi:N-acetylmuramoyl-L-alanine amidase